MEIYSRLGNIEFVENFNKSIIKQRDIINDRPAVPLHLKAQLRRILIDVMILKSKESSLYAYVNRLTSIRTIILRRL